MSVMSVRLTIVVFVLAVLALAVSALRFGSKPPSHTRCEAELWSLANALDYYKARHGELFPNSSTASLIQHIRKAYPYATDIDSALTTHGLKLKDLDDAESLVLFLSGNIEDILGRSGSPAFDFSEHRLKDIDADGWPEYVTDEGERFRYDGVLPLVYRNSLGVWMTVPAAGMESSR